MSNYREKYFITKLDRTKMNYYNTNIQFKYELLKRKIFRLTLVLSQDMDAEPCKNYELRGGLKMQKKFKIFWKSAERLHIS